MSSQKKILVAGIGNIFLGDDGFGSEVARRLNAVALPSEVNVKDFGIRSYDLAYAMMDDYDVTILVDAASRGEAPGTVYLIEPDLNELDQCVAGTADAHTMDPMAALRILRTSGCAIGKLYLVACEPETLETEDGQIELSESVRSAVPRAIVLIKSIVMDFLEGGESSNASIEYNGPDNSGLHSHSRSRREYS